MLLRMNPRTTCDDRDIINQIIAIFLIFFLSVSVLEGLRKEVIVGNVMLSDDTNHLVYHTYKSIVFILLNGKFWD